MIALARLGAQNGNASCGKAWDRKRAFPKPWAMGSRQRWWRAERTGLHPAPPSSPPVLTDLFGSRPKAFWGQGQRLFS